MQEVPNQWYCLDITAWECLKEIENHIVWTKGKEHDSHANLIHGRFNIEYRPYSYEVTRAPYHRSFNCGHNYCRNPDHIEYFDYVADCE